MPCWHGLLIILIVEQVKGKKCIELLISEFRLVNFFVISCAKIFAQGFGVIDVMLREVA